MSKEHYDVVIVGAGIVGLATAMRLGIQHHVGGGSIRLGVVETESTVGSHQSGHNSGVLHSGIYYKPGSQKALLCRSGKAALQDFCDQYKIPWDRCGKVVVATTDSELSQLDRIADRATQNGVDHRRIDTDELRELEPSAAGIAALHVPETGIVNYRRVCEQMATCITNHGDDLRLRFKLEKIKSSANSLSLISQKGTTIHCDRMINCAGLHSDRVFKMAGGISSVQIVPFRGEYYDLVPKSEDLCRNLIYPVPDPSFPFLGVHFTRMIDGGVECGPNAVLALSRHGYSWSQFNAQDLREALGFRGFQSLAVKHWKMGLGEIHRSVSKRAFVRALQKLIPRIESSDLRKGRAGVRAQALSADGNLVDDFLIERTDKAVHVLNAPSPAATASIAIADEIVNRFNSMSNNGQVERPQLPT